MDYERHARLGEARRGGAARAGARRGEARRGENFDISVSRSDQLIN